MRLELRLEYLAETKYHVRFFTGVVTGRFNGTFLERNLGAPFFTEVSVRGHGVIEELETQHVEPM